MFNNSLNFNGEDFDVAFKKACESLVSQPEYNPRSQKTRELIDATMIIEDPMKCVLSNPNRKLSIDYLKAEFDWYISGSLYIDDIKNHASMWEKISDNDGKVNSNYGYFVFKQKPKKYNGSQFKWCLSQLIGDENTRQAIINFNQIEHKHLDNKDFVCTISIQFFIRDNKLHSKVNMRSCDIIYGASFDIPWFAFVQYTMLQFLKRYYPSLTIGKLIHNSASLHIYDRHYKMLDSIINDHNYYESKNLNEIFDLERMIYKMEINNDIL